MRSCGIFVPGTIALGRSTQSWIVLGSEPLADVAELGSPRVDRALRVLAADNVALLAVHRPG